MCKPLLKMGLMTLEDSLMANANVIVYPDVTLEAWEKCHFNLNFPKLDHLKESMTERCSNRSTKKDKELSP